MTDINNIDELNEVLEKIQNGYNNELIAKLNALQESFQNRVVTSILETEFNAKYNQVVREAHTNAQTTLDTLDLTNVMGSIALANSPRARNLPDPNLDMNASASASQKSKFNNLDIFKDLDVAPNDKPGPQTDPTNFDLSKKEIKEFLDKSLDNKLKNVPRMKFAPQPSKKNELENEYKLRATLSTPRLTR